MPVDRYKNKLKDAQRTWLEAKVCRFHNKLRKKDRADGRMDKRAAKQKDRKEIEVELNPDLLLELNSSDD